MFRPQLRHFLARRPELEALEDRLAPAGVTYHGGPAITYFSASTGGWTESIEDAWPGSTPEPWLKGVPDPYDNAGGNPYYHWTYSYSMARAQAKLGRWVKGQLVGIQMGFGIASLIDPQSNTSMTVIAQWQQLLALLLFLALDVHHLLIRALLDGLRAAPPGRLAL